MESDLDPRDSPVSGAADPAALERGRDSHARRAWLDAWESLSSADRQAPLDGADLERLATAAYMLGFDDEYLAALERAYDAFLAGGETQCAVRCAFWLGLRLLFRAEVGRATGWLTRAQRLLDAKPGESAEHGYLLLPVVEQHLDAGELDAAFAAAARAAEIGDRFGEADLSACARHQQGRVRIQQGQVAQGLALLDEAMLAVASRNLSPLITGLIYCSVIEGCQSVYALGRAHEWTTALAEWCNAQPDMVAFSGACLVHRAEIKQLRGAWSDAIDEAQRALQRCQRAGNRSAAAAACYQEAEIHRLRGAFAAAEHAYGCASEFGRDPQPGLALLRATQGRVGDAVAAIDRALGATTDPLQRARLLPACAEIMIAAGRRDAARHASEELQRIASSFGIAQLDAMAALTQAEVGLMAGDARSALVSSRRAMVAWQQAEAPYLMARVRMVAGLACQALGDTDGAKLELGAARTLFEHLGAGPDLARLDALAHAPAPLRPSGLTKRELQVLQLVATGKTNKSIAADLFLSEKTIDRHVSNILAKLDLSSRAAATAWAYEHRLVRPD
jgi:DNA-binding CsgD family transcriptional regulator/tetratricopeptide (TPR) repeat protein